MRRLVVFLLATLCAGVGLTPLAVAADFQTVTGKTFDQAVVTTFYLEAQSIPVQKRNAAMVKTPAGARVLFALLDTSGYGAEVGKKYQGMIITEGQLNIGGKTVEVGSYGFGLSLVNPSGPPAGAKIFNLYNQAGVKLLEWKATRDEVLGKAKPLQVITKKGKKAKLYIGRDWIEIG